MKKELMRYKVVLHTEGDDENEKSKGWNKIAIVKNPAVMVRGMAFEHENIHELCFKDDVKMRIAAPISIPMEIPRKAIKGFNNDEPFIAEFTAENIEEMVVDFMANPNNLVDAFKNDHKGETVPAYLLELWLVEEPLKDKSFSTFGIKVPKGTAFGVTQFTDRDYYNKMIQEGKIGFSIEGNFGLELELSEENETLNYSDVIVLNDKNEVLMLHRNSDDEFEPNKWGLPGGKIEGDEQPIESAKRELFEETGIEIDIVELEAIENEDGTTSNYFVGLSNIEPKISKEHDSFEFMNAEKLKESSVIMGQNERFINLLDKAILGQKQNNLHNKEKESKIEQMKEGEEFEINGVMYVVKDGKPVLKEAEKEIEAEAEMPKKEEKEGEKEVKDEEKIEAAAEPVKPAEPAAESLTKEDVMAMIKEFAQPIIDEAIKTVVEEFTGKEDAKKEDEKSTEMEYSEQKIVKALPVNKGMLGYLSKKKK